MEQNSTTETTQPAAAGRPTFLTVLCILTWISSGFLFLIFILATIAFGVVGGMLSKVGMGAIGEIGAGAMGAFALSYLLMLLGAIFMWKQKKMGFFLYVGGNLINIILPFVFKVPGVDYLGIFIVLTFIALYAINLKHLK